MKSQNVGLVLVSLFALAAVAACSSDSTGGAAAGGAGGAAGGTAAGGTGGKQDGGLGGTSSGGANTAGGSAGGSGGANQCASFTPCGGDLTGNWKIDQECVSAATRAQLGDSLKLCPAATVEVTTLKGQGTGVFDASSLKRNEMLSTIFTEVVPTSCLSAGQDCTALAQAMTKPSVTAQCVAAAAGCTCTVDVELTLMQDYSYVKTGMSFTTTDPSDGTMETFDYCVAGNVLRMRSGEDITVLSR